MATSLLGAGSKPETDPLQAGIAPVPGEATALNLYKNANPDAQRDLLDALPVLVFLERAGKIVFANAEAREMLGLTEGRWYQPLSRHPSG